MSTAHSLAIASEPDFTLTVAGEGKIVHAQGHANEQIGWSVQELCRSSVLHLVAAADRQRIGGLLRSTVDAVAMRQGTIDLVTARGTLKSFSCALRPQPDGLVQLSFHRERRQPEQRAGADDLRFDPPEIDDGYEGFFAYVGHAVADGEDDAYALTLLQFEAVDGFSEGIAASGLRNGIERSLQSWSDGGRATQLEGRSYGVLHHRDADIAALMTRLQALADALGLHGQALAPEHATMAMDRADLAPRIIQHTAQHAMRRFLGAAGRAIGFSRLSEGYDDAVAAAKADAAALRRALVDGVADVEGRPLAALQWSGTQVLETRVRPRLHDGPRDPLAVIDLLADPAFAEEVDAASLALAAGCFAKHRRDVGNAPQFIATVSRAGLATGALREACARTTSRYDIQSRELVIRAPGLWALDGADPAFQALCVLAADGHPACLTRYDAAITGYAMIQSLRGYVEVPAAFITRLSESRENAKLLTRLLQIWRDAGVNVVATGVNDLEQLDMVKAQGVGFARGVLFGDWQLLAA